MCSFKPQVVLGGVPPWPGSYPSLPISTESLADGLGMELQMEHVLMGITPSSEHP